MPYHATKQRVFNRGAPPDGFLDELVAWGRSAADELFAPNQAPDIYASVVDALGPWNGPAQRRAAMLEVMRVLAGFESSWNWNADVDPDNPHAGDPATREAGAWQVSADSMNVGQDLKDLVLAQAGARDAATFQQAMKANHPLAMEYIVRLLRHTTAANGPVERHEIDPYLHRDAMAEFETLLAA